MVAGMGSPEEASRYFEAWDELANKVLSSLDEHDMRSCFLGAAEHYGPEFEDMGEEGRCRAATSWAISCFRKGGRPVVDWYLARHGHALTEEEKGMLAEGRKSVEGFFLVRSRGESSLELEDVSGKAFTAEMPPMGEMPPGTCILARLHSRGGGRFFLPGVALIVGGEEEFYKMKRHFKFRGSWGNVIPAFFRYLRAKKGLSERTADKHAENVVLLTFLLERKMGVDSFGGVTKAMLKTEFRRFVKRYILSSRKIDMDEIYYSLLLFFRYLDEENGIKNEKVLGWLKDR